MFKEQLLLQMENEIGNYCHFYMLRDVAQRILTQIQNSHAKYSLNIDML